MSRPSAAKGENYELRADLNSEITTKRADAIKRVIANMTVGKDVSGLFPSVLLNMQTDDLEQKKLVYLYLMNYAASQPELVILAVNTFVKDTADPNPLVRALAIRTMARLRAEKIIDYLADPLQKCLRDENPYVRKTAALAVAKLYDLKPELAVEGGFVEMLKDMVGDSNPMVVANAVTALTDIHEASLSNHEASLHPPSSSSPSSSPPPSSTSATTPQGAFILDSQVLNKLLVALNECSEWGRIAILNALATYRAVDEGESEHICERVMPQFQHANGSVLLSAVRVVMIHMKHVTREDLKKQLVKKMAPPLVTLLSSPPEIQWVALRNISLLLQHNPSILSHEIRVFFCKYNDPPYVKVEKLEVMVRLASEGNVDVLLGELKEYASEVDVDFVRKAVKAIGQTAIKIDGAASRCVDVLLELIATRVSYVVQEAIVVMKDIFRKYPSEYEGIIPTLCSALDELDEPEAKASLIWIIGQYADKIDNADELLGVFLATFKEESYQVQLQILTAIVKLFLKKPDESQTIVQQVLQMATKDCDSPDVRDRAYMYWRLLSTDPGAAKAVVLADRPPISLPQTTVPPAVLDELLGEISTLASVYHKPAHTFVGRGRIGIEDLQKRAAEQDEDLSTTREKALDVVAQGQKAENLLDFDDEPLPSSQLDNSFGPQVSSSSIISPITTSSAPPPRNALDDMLDLFSQNSMAPPSTNPNPNSAAPPSSSSTDPFSNLRGFGSGGFGQPMASPQVKKQAEPSPPAAASNGGGGTNDLLGLF